MSQHLAASNRSSGFTLIEALVSLAILTVGLIPAFLQASNAVRLTSQIRNSMIAAGLAQEGTEITHAIRDANWFATQPFDTGLTGCENGCRVRFDSTSMKPLLDNPPLKIDPANGLYQYQYGDTGLFTRTIFITRPSNHELKVVTTVTWSEQSGPKSYSIESHLFDWIK